MASALLSALLTELKPLVSSEIKSSLQGYFADHPHALVKVVFDAGGNGSAAKESFAIDTSRDKTIWDFIKTLRKESNYLSSRVGSGGRVGGGSGSGSGNLTITDTQCPEFELQGSYLMSWLHNKTLLIKIS